MDIPWRSYKHASQDQYLQEDYSYKNGAIIMVLTKVSNRRVSGVHG